MSGLKEMLIRHEGLRLKPYIDTRGKLTLGVGRNIDDVGISAEEALALLDNDILGRRIQLAQSIPCFARLETVRQDVLIDMAFMGVGRLMGFRRMLAALAAQDFDRAASEMLASDWAAEVKGRAVELAQMMRTGQYPA